MPRELGKVHTEKDWKYHHVRVGPRSCRVVGTKVLSKEKGVLARVCCPIDQLREDGTCKGTTKIKSVLFPKDRYSKRQAEASAKQFR